MRLPPVALGLAALAASGAALAEPQEAPPAAAADPGAPQEDAAAALRALQRPPGPTFHLLGTLFFGDGFRFNNPYRLKTQLGESARTVSVTAPYVDLGVALAVGDAFGLQHGAALNLSLAMGGVAQAVLAPTYTVTYRGASHRFLGFGRLGPAIVLSPDANVGGELGAGGALFLTARIAVTAEVVGNLFYGAATKETGFPVYPVLSLQLGLLLDHEVLPCPLPPRRARPCMP